VGAELVYSVVQSTSENDRMPGKKVLNDAGRA